MSLNPAERARTSEELQTNLRLTGASPEEVQADLGFTAQQLDDTLGLRPGCDPADVWLLRDHLEQAVRVQGGTPAPYTVLTERARRSASRWFALRRLPRRR